MAETSGSIPVSTRLQQIAKVARAAPDMVLTTLAHHIDIDLLFEAYRRTRKDGAVGVDGQTAVDYRVKLGENLQSLLERFKSGSYRAPAVRRVYIPKGDGRKTRPLGIPTFEDKILQRALLMVLEQIYEQDFLDCSYGFRPGRSAHQAIEALWEGLMQMRGAYVLDVDIQGFFDNLDHGHLREILDQRVRDGVIRRTIGKWLNAGVLEEASIHRSETGTPQGGVISPLLADVYLHAVLDTWFENEIRPRMRGQSFLIRYADDFVMAFSEEEDARRVMAVLPKRLGRYGLKVHADKTRFVRFKRPNYWPGSRRKHRRPETFDLLGFTHYWGVSRKRNWVVHRRTAKDRFSRSLKRIAQWCRKARHLSMEDQHKILSLKVKGHYNYFGITNNSPMLQRFRDEVLRVWRKWLNRRSHKARMTWERFASVQMRYPLPPAVVIKPRLQIGAKP